MSLCWDTCIYWNCEQIETEKALLSGDQEEGILWDRTLKTFLVCILGESLQWNYNSVAGGSGGMGYKRWWGEGWWQALFSYQFASKVGAVQDAPGVKNSALQRVISGLRKQDMPTYSRIPVNWHNLFQEIWQTMLRAMRKILSFDIINL